MQPNSWMLSREFWAHVVAGMVFTAVMGAPMFLAIHTVETVGGPISAIASTVAFVLTFAAILLFGLAAENADGEVTLEWQAGKDSSPVTEWLRKELRRDIERWRSTSPRGWMLTAIATVFTVGLAFRAFLHLFVLALVDEPGVVEWGLAVTPVDGIDPAVVTDTRWLVAGVGLLMVGYGRGLPPVAEAAWMLQAVPLLADGVISLDEDLDIGVAARFDAAASHQSTSQNHDPTQHTD